MAVLKKGDKMETKELRKEILTLLNKGDWIVINGERKVMTKMEAIKIVCLKYDLEYGTIQALITNDSGNEKPENTAEIIEEINGLYYICEKDFTSFKLKVKSKGFNSKQLAHQYLTKDLVMASIRSQDKDDFERVGKMYA
jgi:hypothetical protein